MARAHAASACDHSDSIKSLAQSIAKPAYHRLQHAEPVLRRTVPVLIVAFLITIFIGAAVQIVNHQREAAQSVRREMAAIAEIVAERLDRAVAADTRSLSDRLHALLPSLVPGWASNRHRILIVTDLDGKVLARLPGSTDESNEKALSQILTLGLKSHANGGEFSVAATDSAELVSRPIKALPGRVTIFQQNQLPIWKTEEALTVTLAAATGFVVLILGFAFHWQSTRARETDAINDTVRGRIDTALNRGRCGLWDWDLARGRIFWSHSMFAMLGIERRHELLTFGEVNALVHPDDINLYELANAVLEAKVGHIDHDFRMRHADGHWIWLKARCELTQPPGEAGPHLIGMAIDVTEQRTLAHKSAEADMRLRDAIETIPEAFVLWDAQNRLVLCNSHFQRLHGLPDSAVVPGTSYEKVIEAGQMPVRRTKLTGDNVVLAGARTFEAELESGKWLHISERRTKDGGYVSVGTDITTVKDSERKLLDNETRLRASVSALLHSQVKLEQQAVQLTELAHRYEQEKIRAEDANQTKTKFLANMSHELRTPLNAIIGFSEIMGTAMFGPLGSEKYQAYCSDILKSGQYLLEVINDILDMSKIEAGRVKLDFQPLQLESIIAESLRVVSGRAESKRLAIETDIAPDLGLLADHRAIKQIAVNLLSNAVKFTPEGGTIKIRGRRLSKSILLAVADTGIGIDSTDIGKLGRPFEQVESQLTRTYQGSGLGLAIAKSLAQLHGGSMRMRSQPGSGTVVFIKLPQRAAESLLNQAA